jgi:flagellar hook-associated protein 3 FlgL
MIFDGGVSTMQKRTSEMIKLQQQLSTNRRMITPSDDPVAAAQALEITQASNVNQLYMKNQSEASDALAMGESQLTDAGTLLQSLYQRIIQLGDGALSGSDRANIATDLRAGFKQLMGYANQTDGLGNYIFSGYRGDTIPFTGDADTGVTYQGDAGHRELQVSASRSLQISESGLDVFMRVPNKSVPFQVNAATGNAGTGVTFTPTVTDASQWYVPGNTQIYDVVFDNTPPATAPAINYTINDYQGNAVGTGTYTPPDITLPDASQLTITGAPAPGSTYSTTNYNVVFDNPSIAPTGSYSYTVFDKQGVAVSGFQNLSYTPASIALPNGAKVSMAGTPSVGDTFNITPSGTTDVFSVISQAIKLAETPNTANDPNVSAQWQEQLGHTITNIQSSMDNLLKFRANIGSRMEESDDLSSAGSARDIEYSTTLSRLQDVDLTKAISDLTKTQTTLQAAQLSFSQVSQLSLFNYLR